ncbi:unnamed protein product, partial [Allacma fusca]
DPRYKLRMFGPKISQRYFTTPLKNEARKVIEDAFTQLRLSGQSGRESNRAKTTSQPSGRAFDFLLDEDLSNKLESELETYLKEPPQNTISVDHAAGGNEVLNFWKENQHRFPILASMDLFGYSSEFRRRGTLVPYCRNFKKTASQPHRYKAD